jgi:Flp pilus assembly protein TadG
MTAHGWRARLSGRPASLIGALRALPAGWRRDRRGSVAAEMGLVALLLTTLIAGVIEFGMIIFQVMEVDNAAESGAAYAIRSGFSSSGITTAVTSATGLVGVQASPAPSKFCGCPGTGGVTAVTCSATCSAGDSPGTYVKVSAQYSFALGQYAVLLGLPNPLTATSTVRIQ